MNFHLFRKSFEEFQIFSIKNVFLLYPDFDSRRLVEWQKKGYLLKIRNGWYCFPDFTTSSPHAHLLAANVIYRPSYISMEYALSYYGLIPEGVYSVTSVTTNKKNNFKSESGIFTYRHVNPGLFFGYTFLPVNSGNRFAHMQRQIMFATPEKAILDLLYLNPFYNSASDMLDLRLNESVLTEDLKKDVLFKYLEKFNNRLLRKRVLTMVNAYSF